jgi:hypothetical protein
MCLWIACISAGTLVLWAYQYNPGKPAGASSDWPAAGVITRAEDCPTLVLFLHPRCPCSRATLNEFSEALAHTSKPMRCYIVFAASDLSNATTSTSDLWEAASRMSGVKLIKDNDCVIAKAFGAQTSGQTFLYDSNGNLLFHGGITASRGHAGDNIGRSAIKSFVETGRADTASTPVFGCSLY